MCRQSSASLIADGAGDIYALRVYANDSGPSEKSNRLQADETWQEERRAQSRPGGETSPRARTSASWKRLSPIEPTASERGDIATMLPTTGKRKKGGPIDVRSPPRPKPRSPWSSSLLTLLTTGLALLFVLSVVHSFLTRQIDPQGCVMSTMTPTYIRMSGFDTEHSRFATKYSLYVYREEGVDPYTEDNIGLRGAPVLFLPGNAGSYKQVRSLSSEASRYFHNVVQHDGDALLGGSGSLDFFMIDFNEDLAAFHGQTIIDQAEYVNEAIAYILTLYHDPRRSKQDPNLPDPSSVILIGHSMGGIVARTTLITPKYQSNSVNTIVTMSTPHARPPLSFDADMVRTYERVNDYWRDSYLQERPSNNPLWHTTLISFAGGGRDTMVPSDYTSLSSLVPETHGFTVFTSTVPDVWSSMDHLAITWCDQFRKALIKSLFEIVDVRRATQTKNRVDRINVFRRRLLTGLETFASKSLPRKDPSVLLTLGDDSRTVISRGNNITMRSLASTGQTRAQLLPLPSPGDADGKLVTLLTDQVTDKAGSFKNLEILFCSVFPLPYGHSFSVLPTGIDLSNGNPGATRLACKTAADDVVRLPTSTRTSNNAFDPTSPFIYLQYDAAELKEHQFLAVVDKATETSKGWLIAQVAERSRSYVTADISLLKLLTRGLHLDLPPDRPTMFDIQIPVLHSSLLAYSLQLGSSGCGGDGELFTPLLRQHIDQPYESKFFVNVKQADISLHGVAPFMPPALRTDEETRGVSFQLWTDSTCDATATFVLKVDIPGSLGKLVMRYRTLLTTFPLMVVAMVLRKQFHIYDATGVFITFTESLDGCLRTSLPILFFSMTIFATSVARSATTNLGHTPASPLSNFTTIIGYNRNDLFLGSSDSFFWFLVPLAGLVSVGVCLVVNYVVLVVTHLLSVVYSVAATRPSYVRHDEQRHLTSPAFVPSTPRRRAITTITLLMLVAFVIPYQFAYVVACLLQLATSIQALKFAGDTRSAALNSFSNYAHSILILMLWILPINLPVLIVWIHNLAAHWFTPFSSHHNIFSIMPIILLVEASTSGMMIPRVTSQIRFLTNIILFSLAVFTAMYGIAYAYMLHQLVNLVALWLVIIYVAYQGDSLLGGIRAFLVGSRDSTTMDDIKKMP